MWRPEMGTAWHLLTPKWSGDMRWHEDAACRGLGFNDDYWFTGMSRASRSAPQVRRALALCQECPVRVLCWQQAASDPMAEGVWGGEYWPSDWTARRSMRRRGPITQSRP